MQNNAFPDEMMGGGGRCISTGKYIHLNIHIHFIHCKMGKTVRTIGIDGQVWESFQRMFPNQASSFIEETMKTKVEQTLGNFSGIDMEIMAREKVKCQKLLDEYNLKLNKILQKEKEIQEKKEKDEMKELQQEKERLESMGKCDGCGFQIGDQSKKVIVGDKQFCKECFFNEHPKFILAQKEQRAKVSEAKQSD